MPRKKVPAGRRAVLTGKTMNFFRLRIINTLLFFLVGAVIGFILKEKFYPAAPPVSPQRYQSVYAGRQDLAAGSPRVETTVDPDTDETGAKEEAEPQPAPVRQRKPQAEPRQEEEDFSSPIVIEPAETEPKAEPAGARVARGVQDDFFKRPAAFSGREVELQLQMITAKRSQGSWRLNFVYTGPGKNIDYLYVDDDEILGDKPDLRIGYVYKVRFRCAKGDTSSGNTLSLLTPTGDKAAWATGISAVE